MGNRLKNNLPLKLLALFLALALWGYVRYTQTSWAHQINSQEIMQVPLSVENVGQDLIVLDVPKIVSLNVRGRPEVLEKIKAEDFAAYLDLRGKGEGPYNLSAEVKVPKDVKLEDVPKVQVLLDVVRTKEFEVKVRTINSLPDGKMLAGFDVKPEAVTVTGPKSYIDEVKSVEVTANLSNAEYTMITKSLAVPLNKDGLPIEKLVCSPKFITVEVKVQTQSIALTLPVRPVITGELPAGYEVKEVIVYPMVVTMTFKTKPDRNYEFVNAKAVDISGKRSTFSMDVGLILPPGGTVLENKTVLVKVALKKIKR